MIATLLDKINVWDIITGHLRTLRDASEAKASWYDYALFYVGPILPVVVMATYGVRLTDTTISVLATSLSILAGLLFNLLVLLHTLQPPQRGEPHDGIVKKLVQELHVNIAYSIVVSLLTILPLIVASYYGQHDMRRTALGQLAIYLCIHFGLTMGMVLKRMNAMLQDRIPQD